MEDILIEIHCILCLEHFDETSRYIRIMSEEGTRLNVQNIIEKYFGIKPNCEEGSEELICIPCWEMLNSFNEFYLKILNAHEKLKNEELFTCVEAFSGDGDEKIKSEDSEGFLGFEDDLENEKEENFIGYIGDHVSEGSWTLNPLSIEDDMPPVGEDFENCFKIEGEENEEVVAMNPPQKDITEFQQSKRKIRTPDKEFKSQKTKEYDEFLARNYKIICCVCQAHLADFNSLKNHFRLEHSTIGYVLCCGRKFIKRGMLVDHIRRHLDPSYFKCLECGKIMSSRYSLELHKRNHNTNPERIYRCDECPKTFYRRSCLLRHKLLHIPEDQKKIHCPECGKTFATKYIMNQHLRLVHLNKYAKICDICGKSIKGGQDALQRHQEEHSGKARSTVQCEHCGQTLVNKYALNRHVKVRHSAEYLEPQTCPICSRVSPNLIAHQRHMKYKHTMERKHACSVCVKAFKRKNDLREHLTTHTGEVLYTCPHCPQTFNSNANMHSHRKKKHRKEWELARSKKDPSVVICTKEETP